MLYDDDDVMNDNNKQIYIASFAELQKRWYGFIFYIIQFIASRVECGKVT